MQGSIPQADTNAICVRAFSSWQLRKHISRFNTWQVGNNAGHSPDRAISPGNCQASVIMDLSEQVRNVSGHGVSRLACDWVIMQENADREVAHRRTRYEGLRRE